MVGLYRLRGRLAPTALGIATIAAVGCQDQLPTRVAETGDVPLRITASVVGTPIATLVVSVTAADITTALVFNLTVTNGTAAGTIKVPPGLARTICVTAMDADGDTTHDGSVTVDVRPGKNPAISLKLTPRSGQLPITVTFGNYGVLVMPTSASIAVGVQVQLAATVTDANGNTVANPAVQWATSQPAVAIVSSSGLVTGNATGTANVVATYEGVAALSTVTVGSGGAAFAGLSAGYYHTCGLIGGVAYCWGYNGYGQLGNGSTANSAKPVPVSGNLTFTVVTSGDWHTCGLAGGVAYCWGDNESGQLGTGSTIGPQQCGTASYPCAQTPVAVKVSGGLTFRTLSAGSYFTCGVATDGATYCWGENAMGELGNGSTTNSSAPVRVSGQLTFAAVSAGALHACGVTTDGTAYCWGMNGSGQLGNGSTSGPNQCNGWGCGMTPVLVSGGLAFASVSAGLGHTCGLTANGTGFCWGANQSGQLGNGSTTNSSVPWAVSGGLPLAAVAAATYHSCAVTTGGAAYCWGDNEYGELGNGSTTNSTVPRAVLGGLTLAPTITVGGFCACGATTGGAAYCWGYNPYGQLGNGSTTNSSVPVLVSSP